MSALRFGVDSASTVTIASIERVTTWAGIPPAWWARYLGSGGHAADPLTAQEAWLLHAHRIPIALVFNDVDRAQLATIAQGFAAADQAVAQAKALGVPHLTTLYADIERGWPLTAAWLVGWTRRVLTLGYGPGAYLGPSDPTVEHALETHPVVLALPGARVQDDVSLSQLSLWAAQWAQAGEWTARHGDRISPPPWLTLPTAEDAAQFGVWQFAGNQIGGTVDLDLLRPDATPAPHLWVA